MAYLRDREEAAGLGRWDRGESRRKNMRLERGQE